MIENGKYARRDSPGFTMEVEASTPEMMEESQSDRIIRHCVRDIQNAVEEGCFEVETPRVNVVQEDILCPSIGWSRDTKFVRAHTHSPGPRQFDLKFDMAVEKEYENFYRDLEADMHTADPRVVLHGSMHLWHMEIPNHDISLNIPAVGDGELELTANLHWLTATVAGWR